MQHALLFASALTLCYATPHAPPALSYGVVDTHVHIITTDNGLTYTWTKPPGSLSPPQSCPCRPPCLCNWTLSDYEETSKSSWKVEQVVFCEVAAQHDDWLREARWVQALPESREPGVPEVGAIIAQTPPGFGLGPVSTYAAELDELQKLPLVRGVRPSSDFPPLNESGLAAFAELGRRGLLVDLNMPIATGVPAEIIAASPKTRFVLEHLGGAPVTSDNATMFTQWKTALVVLAGLKNVECIQLGGVVAGYGKAGKIDAARVGKFVKAAIQAFGYERTCFEGNWFFNNWGPPHADLGVYGKWATLLTDILDELHASEAQKRASLRDTALRVYGLK